MLLAGLAMVFAVHAAAPVAWAGPASDGVYRLPYADGQAVEVFDDIDSHRPQGRLDLFAPDKDKAHPVVAAADGVVMAIQDGYAEQQSGRAAALCHNNYVWIAHPNGEWTGYSHIAQGSATRGASLKVGAKVRAGQAIGVEDAVGCAMLKHVHFEVARPDPANPIDLGGFLTDNADGARLRSPRFCGVAGAHVRKGEAYRAEACPAPLAGAAQTDLADLEAIPKAFGAAWARGDAQALGELMSRDVDFVTVGGAWFHGRGDFALYHKRLLEGRFRGSTIEPLEIKVRLIRPDLAFVRWSWRMTGDLNFDGSPRPARAGLMSMLAERQAGRWVMTASPNTNGGPGNAPENEGIDFPIRLPPNPPGG